MYIPFSPRAFHSLRNILIDAIFNHLKHAHPPVHQSVIEVRPAGVTKRDPFLFWFSFLVWLKVIVLLVWRILVRSDAVPITITITEYYYSDYFSTLYFPLQPVLKKDLAPFTHARDPGGVNDRILSWIQRPPSPLLVSGLLPRISAQCG